MVSVGQQSTIAKPHLHVMLNQVGIREGLKKFGEEGNNAPKSKRRTIAKEERRYDVRRKKESTKVPNVFKRKKGWNN